MNGHYHFGFKNGRAVNEGVLADAIAKVRRAKSPVTDFGFVCQFGCGTLHPFSKDELEAVHKAGIKKLPTMEWTSCGGSPVVPVRPPGLRYEARYPGGFTGSTQLDSDFVVKLKARPGLLSLRVVTSDGIFVRFLNNEEHDELVRLGYNYMVEVRKAAASPPEPQPVEVKSDSLPPALVVKCPDGVNRTVTGQQLENLLVASVRMVSNMAAWDSFQKYGGVMTVANPTSNNGLTQALDNIYDCAKKAC